MMHRITRELIPLLVIAVAVALCYFNSFDAPMLFDDHHNIENNENVHLEVLSLESLRTAAFGNRTSRPVAYLTFAFNHYFGGQEVWGYHLVNTLIHFVNGLLVFWLVRFICKRLQANQENTDDASIFDDQGWWVALVAGLLFVVHPVQTQSVTYIVQRMASLSTLFYFAALLAYFKSRVATSKWRIGFSLCLSFLFWLLALGSKEMAVTLPLAILLSEWILFRKGDRYWLKTGLGYLAGALVVVGIVVFVFKGMDAPKLLTRGYGHRDFTLIERVLTQGRVMIHYITLAILPLPSRLTLIYDYPVSQSLLSPATTLFSWVGIAAAISLSFVYAHRYPVVSFSVLWFFLHLAVESTVIPLELVYEHRLYLPMFGVCLLTATALAELVPNQKVAVLIAASLCLMFGYWTHVRNETWRTATGLWQDNIAKQPNEPRSWFNLGVAYAARDDRENACTAFARTIELEPRLQKAYYWHAVYLKDQRKFDESMAVCDAGMAIPPEKIRGDSALGDLLNFRVEMLMQRGDVNAALQMLNRAIHLYPDNPRRYVLRAQCYISLNKPDQAIDDFVKALQLSPGLFQANNNYAWMLATHPDQRIANGALAVTHATRACELTNWKSRLAIVTLAAANARAGNFDAAVRWQTKGLEMAAESDRPQLLAWLRLFEQQRPLIIE